MRRVFIGGTALLLAGAAVARGKSDSVVFVLTEVDRKQELALLRPMIAPDIGVQLDSGPKNLAQGSVLRCEPAARFRGALVDGQISQVTELLLDCGERKFVVKTLEFRPHGK